MLIQSPPIFIWYTIAELDVQSHDPYLIGIATTRGDQKRQENEDSIVTYITSLLSSSGTISSTNAFGVLFSAVSPVAQH